MIFSICSYCERHLYLSISAVTSIYELVGLKCKYTLIWSNSRIKIRNMYEIKSFDRGTLVTQSVEWVPHMQRPRFDSTLWPCAACHSLLSHVKIKDTKA